jgi:hypothetical protein
LSHGRARGPWLPRGDARGLRKDRRISERPPRG